MIKTGFEVLHLLAEFGILGILFKLNYKWNAVLDRIDLLYKAYCDEHNIPFYGLKNTFD